MFRKIVNKLILGIFLIYSITPLSTAQSDKNSGIKWDTEKSNQSVKNIRLIRKRGLSIESCRRIAYDYLKSEDKKTKAIPYLEFVLDEEKNTRAADIRSLALAYYHNDQFGLAVDLTNQYLEITKNGKLKRNAKKDLELYKRAELIASDARNIQLINLGPNINSKYAEINPFVSFQEDLLVYSSKKRKDYNIYVSKKKKHQTLWNKAKLAGKLVNTVDDEFVAGLSSDGNTLFVHYNQHSGFEDINESNRVNGLYRELDNMGSSINSTYREEGACYSKSGDTLFFASDRSGGYGGFDLYYSLKIPGGKWGKPINMGPNINTEADENYPNLDPNSSTIYFASKGHGSIGGYDVFSANWNSEQNGWEIPVTMGYPINNTFDNKTIRFTESPRYAYMSSIMKKGIGNYDIYKVVFLDKEADYLIIRGSVYVKDSEETIPFNTLNEPVSITVYKDDELFGIYAFNKKRNTFILALDPGTYYLEVEAENYKPVKKKFTIKENHYRNKKRKINIYLEPEKD